MLTKTQQAEFRPIVRRAWEAVCRQTGRNVSDIVARDAWYRGQLKAAAGIRSTKEADDHAYHILINLFIMLSEGGDFVHIQGWTEPQNTQFRRLAETAWKVASRRGQTEGQTFTSWLNALLGNSGIANRHAPDRVASFDRVMADLAIAAGDDYWIDRTAHAAEIRMRHLIGLLMSQLSDLTGESVDWPYCRAIYQHMNLPLTIEEASAQWLWKIMQALDTHLRRLQERPHGQKVA
jgi:hypothetical protein